MTDFQLAAIVLALAAAIAYLNSRFGGHVLTMTTPTMAPVAVIVHVKGGPCDSVRLELFAADSPAITETCHGADAHFDAVPPGHYIACAVSASNRSRRCEVIAVDDVPAAQEFDVPRQ